MLEVLTLLIGQRRRRKDLMALIQSLAPLLLLVVVGVEEGTQMEQPPEVAVVQVVVQAEEMQLREALETRPR